MSKRPVAKQQANPANQSSAKQSSAKQGAAKAGVKPQGRQITGSSSTNFVPWIIGGVFVVIVAALVVALTSSGGSDAPAASNAAAVLKKVAAVKPAVFEEVGKGTANNPPQKIKGEATKVDGKPQIVYVGAEYCPYCAAQRWAMVSALSRFGAFSKIGLTHSSSSDVNPNTQTFTFRGSEYQSDYLSFSGTETESNQLVNGSYGKLDTPTADVQKLIDTYNTKGSIPFVYFGGKYVLSGATYSPDVLAGKTADQIATALSDTSSDISKGAIGSANVMTAAICAATDQKPANVCQTATMKDISKQLAAGSL